MEADGEGVFAINQKYAVVMIPPRTTVRLELYQVTDFHLLSPTYLRLPKRCRNHWTTELYILDYAP